MNIKLITKEIARALPSLNSMGEFAADQVPVVMKLFTPDAQCTWFIVEGNLETGELYGLCDLGMGCPELGYVSLQEITKLRGKFGLPVERDRYYSGTLADAMRDVGYTVQNRLNYGK